VTGIGAIMQNARLVKEMLARQPSQSVVARKFIHADNAERLAYNTTVNILLLPGTADNFKFDKFISYWHS